MRAKMRKKLYLSFLFIWLFLLLPAQVFTQQGQTYESAMQSGNQMLEQNEYISAKTYFEMALRLRENDPVATQKLNETLELIRQQMAIQEAFFQKMDQGDALYRQDKLTEARTAYKEALNIIPDDSYTLEQLEKINQTLKEEQERRDNYARHMRLGDSLLAEDMYSEALFQFQMAADIFAENDLPDHKIKETQSLLAERSQKEQAFEQLIQQAEQFISRRDYAAAIEQYEEALKLFPEDEFARSKLDETLRLFERNQAYEDALAEADQLYTEQDYRGAVEAYRYANQVWPEQAYPADMIARLEELLNDTDFIRQEAFAKAIETANAYYNQMDLANALKNYELADSLKPNDAFVAQRIAEIRNTRAEAQQLAELETNYHEALVNGQEFMQNGQFQPAIEAFETAISLKPQESLPRELLQQTLDLQGQEQALADNLAAYETTIEAADKLLNEGALEDARLLYEKAAALPVDVLHARNQIDAIDSLLLQRAAEEIRLANFNSIVQQANKAFNEEAFHESRILYVEAFQLLPSESYPQERINEIDGILSERAAETEAIENEFIQLISKATQAYNQNELEEALDDFIKALALKPDAALPHNKIEEIESLMNEQLEAERRMENYQVLIEEADGRFENDSLQIAKSTYSQALQLMPEQSYPAEQIATIDAILAEREATRKAYIERIAIADAQYENEQLLEARQSYLEALDIQANEAHPASRLESIASKLAEKEAIAQKEARIEELIAFGDESMATNQLYIADSAFAEVLRLDENQNYAWEKRREIESMIAEAERRKQLAYENSISLADQHFNNSEWEDAKLAYEHALENKPKDAYAHERLSETKAKLEAEKQAMLTAYNEIIRQADRHFNDKAYDLAIEKYRQAEFTLPKEDYPGEMIRKINQIFLESMLVEVNSEKIRVDANNSHRFEFAPIRVSERRASFVLFKARNMGEKDFTLIFSYGSDSGRNGGFVVPIPASDEPLDFIIRIGSQYRWFSEDNNWFTVYPENGDIEIGLVQISRGN